MRKRVNNTFNIEELYFYLNSLLILILYIFNINYKLKINHQKICTFRYEIYY